MFFFFCSRPQVLRARNCAPCATVLCMMAWSQKLYKHCGEGVLNERMDACLPHWCCRSSSLLDVVAVLICLIVMAMFRSGCLALGLATTLQVWVTAVIVAETMWSVSSNSFMCRCSRNNSGSQSMVVIVVMVLLIALVVVSASVFHDVNAMVVAAEIATLSSASALYGWCRKQQWFWWYEQEKQQSLRVGEAIIMN